jgi:uncharacterized protein YndB with AHSA1/START domain
MADHTASSNTTINVEKKEFVMERVFDAPRELVFRAYAEPELLAQWWGPKGWTLPVCKIDFRPGGVWHYCMKGPGGEEAWGKAIYREIVAPERIVYTDMFSDAAGNVAEGMPEMVTTVTFTEHGGRTKLISRTQFASAADLQATLDMGMAEGAAESWDRLAELLIKA